MKLFTLQACGAKFHFSGDFVDEADIDDVVLALVKLARDVSFSTAYTQFLLSIPFKYF